MRIPLQSLCDNYIENKNTIQNRFFWDSTYIYPVCALIFTDKRVQAEPEKLKECLRLLKSKTGVFSNFRSTIKLAMVSMLAVSPNPEEKVERTMAVYSQLKKHFFTSQYLPLVSAVIADSAQPSQYEEIAARTRQIYDLMKQNHFLLTSGEDSVFAALLALSPMSNKQIVAETEKCYQLMKKEFHSSNAVQSLSHALALCDGSAEEKCAKTIALYRRLAERGYRYGRHYELPTLGVLAMLPAEPDSVANDIIEVTDYLRGKRGYGFFGVGKRQRMMHAGMLVSSDYIGAGSSEIIGSAAISVTISLIIAQEVAICAAIAASSASSASASS